MSSTETLVNQIVAAVADHADIEPFDLPPLYEVVDPDALEALYSDSNASLRELRFTYAGFAVTIVDPDTVQVAPRSAHPDLTLNR